MFSFGKLLVLALMIGAVVVVGRWLRRFERLRTARTRDPTAAGHRGHGQVSDLWGLHPDARVRGLRPCWLPASALVDCVS